MNILSRNFKRRKLICFFVLISLLALHLSLLWLTRFRDWPEVLLYPWLVHQGLHLYKDMYISYPPGSVYLTLPYFLLTNFNLVSYRLLIYGLILINDILLFFISLSLWKKINLAGLVIFIYIILQVILFGNTGTIEYIFIPLLLTSFWMINKYLQTKSSRFLLWAGIMFGISFQIKQTVYWPFVGIILFLFFFHRKQLVKAVYRISIFILPTILLFLCVSFYYVLQGSFREFFYWIITYPLSLAKTDTSYASFPRWQLALQMAALYSGVFISLWLFFQKKISFKNKQTLVLMLTYCFSLVLTGLPRWEEFRMQSSLPFAVLATGFAIYYFPLFWKKILIRNILIIVAIPIFILSSHYLIRFFTIENPKQPQYFDNQHVSLAKEIESAVESHPVYFFGRYEYFYFLINQKPQVLPWTHHFSWMLEAAHLYSPIIARIDSAQIPYLVLYQPETASQFMTYIESHYRKVKTLSDGGWVMKINQ